LGFSANSAAPGAPYKFPSGGELRRGCQTAGWVQSFHGFKPRAIFREIRGNSGMTAGGLTGGGIALWGTSPGRPPLGLGPRFRVFGPVVLGRGPLGRELGKPPRRGVGGNQGGGLLQKRGGRPHTGGGPRRQRNLLAAARETVQLDKAP